VEVGSRLEVKDVEKQMDIAGGEKDEKHCSLYT